jgi:hypothetical protein
VTKHLVAVIVACVIVGAIFANGLGGQRLEKVVNGLIVDVGTDQPAAPVAGKPIQFDFNLLRSDTRDPVTSTSVGIDIGRDGKSLLNCDLIIDPQVTFLFYTFPEAGDYTLTVSFFDKNRSPQQLATATFPITISGSASARRARTGIFAAAAVGVALGLLAGYWGGRRQKAEQPSE